MKIHASAKFDNKDFGFHNEIDVDVTADQIQEQATKIINKSISKFKEKCSTYFKVDFATMCFFEVYYFTTEKEINLFKKEKV